MSTHFLSIFLSGSLMAFAFLANAQKDSSGIYNTADDYKARRLTYAINYKTEQHKINDYLFLNASQVKVKHEGKTYLLDKNKIYGYRSTKGQDFRFVGNQTYEILNPGEAILLYKHTEAVTNPKSTFPAGPHYYFTAEVAQMPIALTIENLKQAFPKDHSFHDALDQNFKKDEDLTSYDRFHKMYKVNWLYKNSTK